MSDTALSRRCSSLVLCCAEIAYNLLALVARFHDGDTKEHAIGHVSKTFGAGRDTLRALLEEYDPQDLV